MDMFEETQPQSTTGSGLLSPVAEAENESESQLVGDSYVITIDDAGVCNGDTQIIAQEEEVNTGEQQQQEEEDDDDAGQQHGDPEYGPALLNFIDGSKDELVLRLKTKQPRARKRGGAAKDEQMSITSRGDCTGGEDDGTTKLFRFECTQCLKSFALEKSLQRHQQTDCGRFTEFACHVCEKGFASALTLQTHMSCHTDQRPFQCQICEKAFRTSMQLNVHSRTHTGLKPYSCDKCSKAFAHRESLLTHQSVHTGYKRFLCNVCGGRFSCISNLKSHRKARLDTCGAHPAHTRPVGENEDVRLLMIKAS